MNNFRIISTKSNKKAEASSFRVDRCNIFKYSAYADKEAYIHM